MKKTIIILITLVAAIITAVLLGRSLAYSFLLINLLLLIISKNRIHSISMGLNELNKCRMLYIIILLLGANIALWMVSGILPTLVYYSASVIEKMNFLLVTFLSVTVVSTVMGTGLGTFSTIGLVFIALSQPLGYPLAVVVGAIVSGAFVSDKISPVSALTNLTIEITGVTYKEYAKESLKTLLPTIIITALFYGLLNNSYSGTASVALLKNALPQHYQISPLLLLVPLCMIVISFLGVSVIKNMLSVTLVTSLIAVIYQKMSFSFLTEAILFGYKNKVIPLNEVDQLIQSIFKGGGMLPMLEVLIIVSLVVFMTGLMAADHILSPLVNFLMKNTKTKSQLILKTGILSLLLNSLSSDQTVGIVVPGEALKPYYDQFNLDYSILARTISDTGTILAPLEFWNVNVLIISGLVGISSIQYGPYAFLLLISPIVTLIASKFLDQKK